MLHPSPNSETLKEILIAAIGKKVVVDKQRQIYFIDNVKFHIDTVKGLGSFMEIEAIDKDTLVVIDGAYMEYAAAKDKAYRITPNDLMAYENVIYLGTFSKAYGLGGMRVGYGIGNISLISQLYKMRPPFNITTLSLVAAIEACKDEVFVEESIALHTEQIGRYEAFAKENGFSYIESYTNFITYLFNEDIDSTKVADALLKEGVIIRNLASYKMNAVRITIGTKEQNDRLFEVMRKVLDE